MHERIYVSIDLETTGLDARRDSIIEIGAVRIQGTRVLDRFSTVVNPRRTIPLRIQQLTGIRDADVAGAPTLDRVLPELLSFVDSSVAGMIGHNAAFDLGFLQMQGINFRRPVFDTAELSPILLPGQPSYNLGELCHALNIPLHEAHRALDDAEATANLFIALHARLCQLPAATLHLISERVRESDWPPAQLFCNAFDQHPQRNHFLTQEYGSWADLLQPVFFAAPSQAAHPAMLQDRTVDVASIPAEDLAHYFAPDGRLAQQMGSGYELRSGQVMMAQQVLQALNKGDHLMVEAGTGTGKSLAYLLPAALWSLHNLRRVVIATHTITLQDQLLAKDIPQVQRLVQPPSQASDASDKPDGVASPVRASVLKGRGNYLCLRRLQEWWTGRQLSNVELAVLAKILVWLPTTTTGDMGELTFFSAAERAAWARICSDGATCNSARCSGISINGLPRLDFYLHAYRQAEQAHLLVINHALLFADIAAGGRVLPPFSHLVVDEAHHLETAATEQLTYRLEWVRIQSLLTRLSAEGDLLPTLLTATKRHNLLQAHELCAELASKTPRVANLLQRFAKELLQFARHSEALRADAGYTQRLAIDSAVRTQPQWAELEVEWDIASDLLRSLTQSCTSLLRCLEDAQWGKREANAPVESGTTPAPSAGLHTATLFGEFQSAATQLSEFGQQADSILLSPEGESHQAVTWLELSDNNDTAILAIAPRYIGDLVEKAIVHTKRTAIFTSATLRANANFAFIRERLGLWDVNSAIVESPFDYTANALLYLPSDLVTPNHPNYQQAVERALIDAAVACNGRSLALFTSYSQVRATAEAVRPALDRLGITVLQHGNSSRQRLLREYRASERAVLLGTRSFWEGVDLPGDELRCLLIFRLPFAAPNDPLAAARSAEFEDPFNEYTLPEAILRFRQGFGRLIRRATDRGVVVLLDSRAWKKEYGQAFLDALPPCTVRRAPIANLGEEIKKWLK